MYLFYSKRYDETNRRWVAVFTFGKHCTSRSKTSQYSTYARPKNSWYHNVLVYNCYVHLKEKTLLISQKIADFGLATRIAYPGETHMTMCGTPNYISPEVLETLHKD